MAKGPSPVCKNTIYWVFSDTRHWSRIITTLIHHGSAGTPSSLQTKGRFRIRCWPNYFFMHYQILPTFASPSPCNTQFSSGSLYKYLQQFSWKGYLHQLSKSRCVPIKIIVLLRQCKERSLGFQPHRYYTTWLPQMTLLSTSSAKESTKCVSREKYTLGSSKEMLSLKFEHGNIQTSGSRCI